MTYIGIYLRSPGYWSGYIKVAIHVTTYDFHCFSLLIKSQGATELALHAFSSIKKATQDVVKNFEERLDAVRCGLYNGAGNKTISKNIDRSIMDFHVKYD